MKPFASVDSSQRDEEGPTTMGKQGESVPLQAHDEFLESRQESSSPSAETNRHAYRPSNDDYDDEDREQQLYSPIPFVRSNTSCSRNRHPQLSITTSVSSASDDDVDSDEDFIDSPSYQYTSLSTPRNSPTHGGLKRSRSCRTWLALAAGAGVAVLGAAAFLGGNGGNTGQLVTAGTEQMNKHQKKMNDPLIKDKDEAFKDTTKSTTNKEDTYDKSKQVSKVIEERFQTKNVPPLSELVVEDEIRGKVDWMVDFAIIGNPKCGTTFLMVRFSMNRERIDSSYIIISLCFSILTITRPLSPLSYLRSIGSLALTIRMCTMARCVP